MNEILNGFITGYEKLKSALIAVNGSFNPDLSAKRNCVYGLFSKPPIKTVVTVLKHGRRNIVISEDNPQVEIELLDGEVALYDGMNTIKLSRAKGIEITSAAKINIGGIGALKLINELFLDLFNSHTHATPAGPTASPVVPAVAATVTTKITEVL